MRRSTPSSRTSRFGAPEAGQSIVEFVLVLPFLLLILFGITQFGIAVNDGADMNQVASAAARKLAVNQQPSWDPVAYVKSIVEPPLNNSTLKVTVCYSGTNPGDSVAIKVTVDKTVSVIPGFNNGGPTLHPSGRATMRLEAPLTFAGQGSAQSSLAPCQS